MDESMPPEDVQLDAIRRCLGLKSVDGTSPDDGAGSSERPTASDDHAAVHAGLPVGFLVSPRLLCTISCRWKKDRKQCGVTDVALADDGRLFVADFLNKAVKIYDSAPVKTVSE